LRKNKSVGLSDCYLAAAAKSNGLKVLSLDKHFEILQAVAGIGLFKIDADS